MCAVMCLPPQQDPNILVQTSERPMAVGRQASGPWTGARGGNRGARSCGSRACWVGRREEGAEMGVIADGDGWSAVVLTWLCCNLRLLLARASQALA